MLYSAASSHPNKVILTVFSHVAEYFRQPPRTLYACYIPLSTPNSNFQCLLYFVNVFTDSRRRNKSINILQWHQAGINSILLLFSVLIGMEASQVCPLLMFAFVAFWYTMALPESKIESKAPHHASKMSNLLTTCKVG